LFGIKLAKLLDSKTRKKDLKKFVEDVEV